MMHTWKVRTTIKDAVFGPYFAANTTDARCMYNTANFYIRNTMTGIRKSAARTITARPTCQEKGISVINVTELNARQS